MPPGRLPGEVFRACPTGKRQQGRPRTRWRDYVSRLAWERLRVPLDELEEVSGEREARHYANKTALSHHGMNSKRPVKVCCGFWHKYTVCVSLKSWKLQVGASIDPPYLSSTSQVNSLNTLVMFLELFVMAGGGNPRVTGRTCKLHTHMAEAGIEPPTLEIKVAYSRAEQSRAE
ncbi:hypothetical protein QTP70_000101 [Hemibagrus guttatus]|uniref:Uncharacterized protein n=1 Tax=Hemibagrus guttatus TaxID=175788 RepID=A0AAE0R3P7_9TELE|nr:hypothetical protein QTP70_000101 [Hemibagrus guttatus]